MPRRSAHASFGLAAAFAFAFATATTSAHAAPETARPADDFVDSLGVNLHLNSGDTAYAQYDTLVKPKLLALGIRHVRDGVITGDGVDGSHPFYRHVRDLYAAGIRFSMITAMDTSFGAATDLSQLVDVYGWSGGAIEDFEGINEPDRQTIPGKPADAWISVTRTQQRALFETVKGEPMLASVRVLGPSITSSSDALGAIGDLSDWVDDGNAHPYPGGFCPVCGTFYGQDVETFLPQYEKVVGGKPMVMTETGYTNATAAGTGGNRPVSEKASAKYLPRLLLEFFNRKFVRTYPYELLDDQPDPSLADAEKHFGIVRADGTEKPAYVAEKSLVALLADPGPSLEPTTLDWSAATMVSWKVHHSLLQKRDGTFFLALWREIASYDTGWRQGPPATEDVTLRKDLDEPPVTVVLTVNAPTFTIAKTHALGDDGVLVTTDTIRTDDGKLAVKLRDAVTVIELGNPPPIKDAGADTEVPDGARDSGAVDASIRDANDAGDASPVEASPDAGGCGCSTPRPTTMQRWTVVLLSAFGIAITRARHRSMRRAAT
jgi:hypothetical protein